MAEGRQKRPRPGNGHGNTITGTALSGPPMEVPAELLAALGFTPAKRTFVTDDDIKRHEDDDPAIVLPRDMDLERARTVIDAKIEEENTETAFNRVFDYRPEDGANAAADVLAEMFGIVVGKMTPGGMFSPPEPPGMTTIKVAHDKTRDVPYGRVGIPSLPGTVLELDAAHGPLGPRFRVEVTTPKKNKKRITELFDAIAERLRVASIYRGHSLQGAHTLEFIDTTRFDPAQIVFSDHVTATLDAALWTAIRHPEAVKAAGVPLRRAVLVYGPFGTGKSSLGLITAKECEKAGWTFLAAKAGKDNLADVMTTAALYQRAVVFVEDIDSYTPDADDRDAVSELLDIFDGITTKDREIILVTTTNHVEAIAAGMLRPGRMDYVVEVAGLDRGGVERLIRVAVPTDRLGPVDFDAVFDETAGFQPAWVRAVADRAQSFALARTGGAAGYRLTTEDLVGAARSLHPQLALMNSATEGRSSTPLDVALRGMVRDAVEDVRIVDGDGDPVGACGGMRLTGNYDGDD